jgi:hypothetical protein
MTRIHTTQRNIRGKVGATLLIVGTTVLLAYSSALAWQFRAALNGADTDSLGFFGSVGLASLHAVRILAFDHSVLLSVMHRILVLCSALIMTLIGIVLVPKRSRGAIAPGTRVASAPPEGDQ